jgi:epoxyqueuosine reductase QueG
MKRAGVRRLRRNLAVAIANSGDAGAIEALADQREPTCADPLVQDHVEWAVSRAER